MLKGKKIVLGITGSIAAYKACLIIRGLVKAGAEVQVVITPAGKEFITPITLSALTHKPVISEFFAQRDGTWNSHVDLGLWADAMLIAPCTASTLGKMANGIADNMLITTYLSMKAPVFIAPAMDLDMYKHPSTQENMKRLVSFGNHIIEPASGFLASGLEGKGRMEEPERIVAILEERLGEAPSKMRGNRDEEESLTIAPSKMRGSSGLEGKKVLITAGPTYEKIDPVRFIGNYSSGKMGFALAEECACRGAEVTLVAGPVSLKCSEAIHRIDVESCEEMYQAATEAFKSSDAAILCAAVADFRPEQQAKEKIKREKTAPSLRRGNEDEEESLPLAPSKKGGEEADPKAPSKMRGSSGDSEDGGMTLRLVANPDIAAALGKMKTEKQVMVGFALETNDEEVNAKKKLEKKNLDFIVLNSLQNKGTCFQSDENQISIISKEGQRDYEKKSKQEVAKDIVEELERVIKAAGNPLPAGKDRGEQRENR
jgi:phosphopantothenoylcysteine decarboxylase/phosphopantothenate--cysteine ligase